MNVIYGSVIKMITGFYIGCTGVIIEPDVYVGQYMADLRCEYKVKNTRIIDGFKMKVERKEFEIISNPRQ